MSAVWLYAWGDASWMLPGARIQAWSDAAGAHVTVDASPAGRGRIQLDGAGDPMTMARLLRLARQIAHARAA